LRDSHNIFADAANNPIQALQKTHPLFQQFGFRINTNNSQCVIGDDRPRETYTDPAIGLQVYGDGKNCAPKLLEINE